MPPKSKSFRSGTSNLSSNGPVSNFQPLLVETGIDNIWSRNSRPGRWLLFTVPFQLVFSVFVFSLSFNVSGLENDLNSFVTAFYLPGVTDANYTKAIRLITLVGDYLNIMSIILGIVGISCALIGFWSLYRQGKTTFFFYGTISLWLGISSLLIGLVTVISGFMVLSRKDQFQPICDILSVQAYCSSKLDEVFVNTKVRLLASSLAMLIDGILSIACGMFSCFSRLVVPESLQEIAKRRNRAIRQQEEMDRQNRERIKEQNRVSIAFRLLDAFQMFDLDASGTIDGNELGTVLTALGYEFTDQEVKQMVAEADTDGDNQIDYNEFIKMMMQSKVVDIDQIVAASRI